MSLTFYIQTEVHNKKVTKENVYRKTNNAIILQRKGKIAVNKFLYLKDICIA
jgi:hypothetical protein